MVASKAVQKRNRRNKIVHGFKMAFRSRTARRRLDSKKKVTNITVRLEGMNFNGYLRLLEIDAMYLTDYMSETSQTLFEDFKSKHQKDEWKCPQCASFFKPDSLKWKCERCLFWFHGKCTKERIILPTDKSQENYSLCDSCFFAL